MNLVKKLFYKKLRLKIILAVLGVSFLSSNEVLSGFDSSTDKFGSFCETPYIAGISDHRKFIWFRVAKVGSSTIRTVLKKNRIPFSAYVDEFYFDPQEYRDYFKFAFVRNPWDRVVSCYSQKVVTKNFPVFQECFDKGFEYFVDFIDRQDLHLADRHIRLQTSLIPVHEVDFIGRLEHFSEDLVDVLKVIGAKDLNIPVKNPSNHEHYSTYYTERTKEIIARKYADDIEAFEYEFSKE